MKKFCESIREHAMEIINFRKKNMKLLTNEQQKLIFQCGFWRNIAHSMIWHSGTYGTLLTDLSKDFDCISHDFLLQNSIHRTLI